MPRTVGCLRGSVKAERSEFILSLDGAASLITSSAWLVSLGGAERGGGAERRALYLRLFIYPHGRAWCGLSGWVL